MRQRPPGMASSNRAGDRRLAELSDWLIDQSFGDPDIVALFGGLCERLHGLGMPLVRAQIAWRTLHPLINAELVYWLRDRGPVHEVFSHENAESEAWQHSPMKFVLDRGLTELRRRLAGKEALIDFPILEKFAEAGYTDHLILATEFSMPHIESRYESVGILSSWTSDHPAGFSQGQIAALKRLQHRLAIACKTMMLSRITRNVADAYLGRTAARRVLSGQIRRGDGEFIEAVVWYSDLRGSTHLAETLPRQRYLALLNRYFECTAGAAIAADGEVLDFIGDAVLAIFPCDGADGRTAATERACRAVADAAKRRREALAADPDMPLDFGIGVSAGEVLFGNIGVPERLTFSVIGPTINSVARIEKETKELGVFALATAEVANVVPKAWQAAGSRLLAGMTQPLPLFAWTGGDGESFPSRGPACPAYSSS